jgi:hypothetical protein
MEPETKIGISQFTERAMGMDDATCRSNLTDRAKSGTGCPRIRAIKTLKSKKARFLRSADV